MLFFAFSYFLFFDLLYLVGNFYSFSLLVASLTIQRLFCRLSQLRNWIVSSKGWPLAIEVVRKRWSLYHLFFLCVHVCFYFILPFVNTIEHNFFVCLEHNFCILWITNLVLSFWLLAIWSPSWLTLGWQMGLTFY